MTQFTVFLSSTWTSLAIERPNRPTPTQRWSAWPWPPRSRRWPSTRSTSGSRSSSRTTGLETNPGRWESKVKPSWNCSKLHQRKVNVFLAGFDNLELVKPWSCVLIMFYLLYKFSQSVSTVSGRQIDGLVSHRRLCPVLYQFLSFFCKNKNIPKKNV